MTTSEPTSAYSFVMAALTSALSNLPPSPYKTISASWGVGDDLVSLSLTVTQGEKDDD